MTKDEAEAILNEFVESDSLKRHCRAVAASMKYFANKFGGDPEKWEITGLLHDFDYEKYPTEHPMKGEPILREKGVDEEIIRAIQSHANYSGVARESQMEKTLFAVDELSGFVVAVAQVRPEGLNDMKVKSVKKKLKTNGFAAAVNRDDISNGAQELGIEQDELIQGVIEALQQEKDALGF